jgi:VCBS repeat-containing protein
MGFPAPGSGNVTEDVDVVGGFLTASGDVDYWLGDDTGQWTAETITGSHGTLVIDEDGVWSYSVDNANPSIQALDTGDTLTDVFTVTSDGGSTTVTITINGQDEPPCFTSGTLIDTPQGPRPVESLRPGDAVLTADHGLQLVRWVGRRRIDLAGLKPEVAARLAPVRIRKDALGPGVPVRDVLVSPMHRLLVCNAATELLFGREQVLAAAGQLANGAGIAIQTLGVVDYVHLLFDRHQLVRSAGLTSESFYPGGVGLCGFDVGAREEVLGLFPELRSLSGAYGPTVRAVLRRHEAVLLGSAMARHSPGADSLAARTGRAA